MQSREVRQVPTIDFYFYLLFENTFHDFVRRAPCIHTYISDTHKNFQNFPLRIFYFSPSIRNGKFWILFCILNSRWINLLLIDVNYAIVILIGSFFDHLRVDVMTRRCIADTYSERMLELRKTSFLHFHHVANGSPIIYWWGIHVATAMQSSLH